MNNIWRYVIEDGGAGGIVIANSEQDAKDKLITAYTKHGYGEDFDFSEMIVWMANNDDGYMSDCLDVLECYD